MRCRALSRPSGRQARPARPRIPLLVAAILALVATLAAFGAAAVAPPAASAAAPSLAWNTFLGGAGLFDRAEAVTTDAAGNIYVAGSSDASWGSPVRAFGGQDDAWVAKLSPSGALLWHTFLGGAGQDFGEAVAVDAGGGVYVAGYSNGTWGSPVRAFSGAFDGFVAKVDASGALVWSTFLGDDGLDEAQALVVDAGGKVVAAGYTSGSDESGWGEPVRPYEGFYDTFVARLSPSDGSLMWNTFLDGGLDRGFGLAAGGDGSVYITGTSNFNWGDPLRPHLGTAWTTSAQVVKLTSAGALVWNTFLGADVDPGAYANDHYGKEVAVDAAGNVYVLGFSSDSWGDPIRPHPGRYDLTTFVARLGSNGALVWNTFLYSDPTDEQDATALAVDGEGNVLAGGSSGSWGTPVEPHHGAWDISLAQLSPAGALSWNTFVGGAGSEHADALAVDGDGSIVLAGYGNATWGLPLRPLATPFDGIVAKLAVPLSPGDTTPPTTTDDADDLWHRTPVTVHLTPADNAGGSGMSGGAAKTEYKVDGAPTWTTGTSVAIGAPADHSNDGAHTISYRSTDFAGNVEPTKSCSVKIDTQGPVTAGKATSGRKGRAIVLRYRITDALSPKATAIRIVVKNAKGKTVKTFRPAAKKTGTWYSVKWTPKARGTFRYYVYAKDLAGNAQRTMGSAKIVVK